MNRCASCRATSPSVRCSCCRILLCSACLQSSEAGCPNCRLPYFTDAETIELVNDIVREYIAHPDLFSLAAAPAREAFARAKLAGVPDVAIRAAGQRARAALRRASLRRDERTLAAQGNSEHLVGTLGAGTV